MDTKTPDYPNHLKVIITDSSKIKLLKSKFLIPKTFTMAQLLHVFRRKAINKGEMTQYDSLFIFINPGILVPNSRLVSQVHAEYNQNGCLYISLCKEATFG